MRVYSVRLTEAHAMVYKLAGGGYFGDGVRALAEKEARGFAEKRRGPKDRRKR